MITSQSYSAQVRLGVFCSKLLQVAQKNIITGISNLKLICLLGTVCTDIHICCKDVAYNSLLMLAVAAAAAAANVNFLHQFKNVLQKCNEYIPRFQL